MKSNFDHDNESNGSVKSTQVVETPASFTKQSKSERPPDVKLASWKRQKKQLHGTSSSLNSIKLFGNGIGSPLCWTLPSVVNELEIVGRIQKWYAATRTRKKLKSTADSIVKTIAQLDTARVDIESALAALGAAQSIGWICDYTDESTWHMTVGKLVSLAAECKLDSGSNRGCISYAKSSCP